MHQESDAFYDLLIDEVENNGTNLADAHYQALAQYYTKLHRNTSLRPFYRYNWRSRVDPLIWTVRQCEDGRESVRLLDAGCGTGTESLLLGRRFQHLEVVGVDITDERLAAARARLLAHQAGLDRAINVTFRNQNVFELLDNEEFDIVWTMEALSHIDPAERFLAAAAASVPPGGYLVVSDSHLLNPAMLWRLYKMRGFRTAERQQFQLAHGEVITCAHERLFAVGDLKKMLVQSGWQPIRTQLRIFFPPSLAAHKTLWGMATKLDVVLGRMPLVRNLGGIYTVVAQRM